MMLSQTKKERENREKHLPKSDSPTMASTRTQPILICQNLYMISGHPTTMKVKTQAKLIFTLFTSLGLNFLRLKCQFTLSQHLLLSKQVYGEKKSKRASCIYIPVSYGQPRSDWTISKNDCFLQDW